MARRSSARLRSRQSPTPQRVSLSHDAPVAATARTPRTAPSKLFSVREADEVPGSFPQSPTPSSLATPHHVTPTPPSKEQMHPEHCQPSTMPPTEEAHHLSFFSMPNKPVPAESVPANAGIETTPSESTPQECPSQPVFTFRREHSLQLSPAAKRLMEEKRDEAARIRVQMATDSSGREDAASTQGRRIASSKVKKGRFSDAHAAAFDKMASIANHASSFRAHAKAKNVIVATPSQNKGATMAAGALKRSPSNAELDAQAYHGGRPTAALEDVLLPSPAKRVKRAMTDDVASSRKRESSKDRPRTPGPHNSWGENHKATTPNVRSRIPGPSMSPAKFSTPKHHAEPGQQSPRLSARAATKSNLSSARKTPSVITAEQPSALLSRSPLKAPPKKKPFEQPAASGGTNPYSTPLLLRSPSKRAVVNESPSSVAKTATVPMLSRSPSRVPLDQRATKDGMAASRETSGKSIIGRSNLLTASPIKSILRSPQRLYSDDPEKIAAGTHLATPERASNDRKGAFGLGAQKVSSPCKRVDFSSSTKARETQQQAKKSVSPREKDDGSPQGQTKGAVNYPVLPAVVASTSPSPQKRRQATNPADFTFRAGEHGIVFAKSPEAGASSLRVVRPTPAIRHVSSDAVDTSQTAARSKKRKFEFQSDMVMPQEIEVNNENDAPDSTEAVDEERPMKRLKATTTETKQGSKQQSKAGLVSKTASRVPTLGVKPKGSKPPVKDTKKRPSTISMARLNALSQPKRRA